MRAVIATLGLFLLPAAADAAESKEFLFPGGVTLKISVDAMTDRTECAIFTRMQGAYFTVQGPESVAVWTSDKYLVSKNLPRLLRLGDAKPFELAAPDRPHLMLVPAQRSKEVLTTLHERGRIRLRFYEWPSGTELNFEPPAGDFASAYAKASELCGWPAIGLERTPLPIEPSVYKKDGYVSASFPDESRTWTVTYMSQFGSCEIRGPGSSSIFSARNRRPDAVLTMGKVEFRDANGELIATVDHPSFSPSPFVEFYAGAVKAGPYGTVKTMSGRSSLYGFLEAVAFAEQTCGFRLTPATREPAAKQQTEDRPPRIPVTTGQLE